MLISLTRSSFSSSSRTSRHHSAPPLHQLPTRTGLDAINENVEYPEVIPSPQQGFPRSSTVPNPGYATVRRTVSNNGSYYYYTEFQPISPSHSHVPRPVDVLKPTFLIVSRATEQRLAAQLTASTMSKRTEKNLESPSNSNAECGYRHVGLLGTPNPSPYVYFRNSPSSDPPSTSVMHDEWTQTLATDLGKCVRSSALIASHRSLAF